MRYRPLGTTGLKVSEISLGTVELGMDYGFQGTGHYRKPDERSAIALIHQAIDEGINLIDTAPVYGNSEELIGKALKGRGSRPYIATKVTIPEHRNREQDIPTAISRSIDASLKALQVDVIDLLQIHNMTMEMLDRGEVVGLLERARRQGKICLIGASIYEEDISLRAIDDQRIHSVQVPFNLLNQEMAKRIFPGAANRGIGVLARSAFLRGLLTSQIDQAPDAMALLKATALAALEEMKGEVSNLSEAALRFCLSVPNISTILIGTRSGDELTSNLAAADKGALAPGWLERLRKYSVEREPLANPANW